MAEKEKTRVSVLLVCSIGFVMVLLSLLLLPVFVPQGSHNTSFDPDDVVAVDKEGNTYRFSTVGRQIYLFLSSSLADEDELSLLLSEDYAGPVVYLNEVPLTAGEPVSFVFTEKSLTLSFRSGVSSFEALTVCSQNLPMLCIDTESGNMNAIHADKEYREAGRMKLVSESGDLLNEQELTYIKGRGNQTWTYEKRPYNIKLSEKASLLGMAEAREWCLLADYTDPSGLRNKLVYSLAGEMGFLWTPSCEYVDVWLNGEYAGVYLLTEKVTVSENRIDITDLEKQTEDLNGGDLSVFPVIETETYRCYDIPNNPSDITEGYVIELECTDRYRSQASWFVLDDGTCFTVKSPEYVSEEQMLYLRDFMQGLNRCLTSSDGKDRRTGKVLGDYADVNSLVRKYLLEEISGNKDSEWSSQYFTLTGGKLYAGPCWDYDHTLGNGKFPLANPETLIVTWRSRHLDTDFFYSRLLNYPGFFDLVCETYEAEVRPLLDGLLTEYDRLRSQTEAALAMNAIRWQSFTDSDTLLQEQAYLLDYLCKRIDFLDRYWIEREDLICLSFVGGGYERVSSVMVPSGTSLADLSDTGLGVTVQNAVLIDEATDEVVLDLTTPLYTDSVFSLRGD